MSGAWDIKPEQIERAQGCLLGQVAGDSLGSLVEFRSAEQIRAEYPNGLRDLQHGGTWGTLAGQPTDDSELALALARTLVRLGRFDREVVRAAYVRWLESRPFDCGTTTSAGLRGIPNARSQSNGALMRVSPLGIFGARYPVHDVGDWAEQDAALTHPHAVCRHCSALFAMAIATLVREGLQAGALYERTLQWAAERGVPRSVQSALRRAAERPPEDYYSQQGWVLIAFQNAFYHLLHTPSFEEAVVQTVMQGGDTDTNGAICGALLGALYGRSAVPERWQEAVLSCRPERSNPHCRHPRPREYWPIDLLDLARQLLQPPTAVSSDTTIP